MGAIAAAGAGSLVSAAPPKGFRSLFNGRTLEGWHASARLPVAAYPAGPAPAPPTEDVARHVGRWTVENGAIVGGQEPVGSGLGAYLVSDEKFGDFELMVDARPDWKVDTGILLRAANTGSPGIQMLLDYRPDGNIGGFYGNGLGPFYAAPYWFNGKHDKQGNLVALEPNTGESAELKRANPSAVSYAAPVEQFLATWKVGQWNSFRIRCEGKYPRLTSWINGVKICEVDLATVKHGRYDREAVAELLGPAGHIAFEVHNNDPRKGRERWWPGAVCRWRNIYVKTLA